jgi:hypothetical protein
VNKIKHPLQWWEKHEAMFPTIGFLVHQILKIVGFQIETKRIFSLVGILFNLRRYRIQLENLEKLIFVNKNWPNDYRVGCKSPSNLLELSGIDANLEEELEQFEGAFEKDEIVNL